MSLSSGEWTVAGDRVARPEGLLEEFVGLEQPVCKTDAERLLGFQVLPAQDDLLRPGNADAARDPGRASKARQQAEFHLGLTEDRLC